MIGSSPQRWVNGAGKVAGSRGSRGRTDWSRKMRTADLYEMQCGVSVEISQWGIDLSWPGCISCPSLPAAFSLLPHLPSTAHHYSPTFPGAHISWPWPSSQFPVHLAGCRKDASHSPSTPPQPLPVLGEEQPWVAACLLRHVGEVRWAYPWPTVLVRRPAAGSALDLGGHNHFMTLE